MNRLFKTLLCMLVFSLLSLGAYHWVYALKGVDSLWYGSMFRLKEELSEDLVVIAVTDADLEKYGPWPWDRDLISVVINGVLGHQPRVLAVDIAFTEPQSGGGGAKLAEALVSEKPIILGLSSGLKLIPQLHQTGVQTAAINLGQGVGLPIGLVAVPYDVDGMPSLALAVASVLGLDIKEAGRHPFHSFSEGYLGFAYVSKINGFAAGDVLENPEALESIAGKTVIMGVTAGSVGDYHFTPRYAETRAHTSGVVIWANAIDALISDRPIQGMPPLTVFLFLLLQGLLVLVVPVKNLVRRIALALGLSISVAVVGKYFLISGVGLVMPAVPFAVNGLLTAIAANYVKGLGPDIPDTSE